MQTFSSTRTILILIYSCLLSNTAFNAQVIQNYGQIAGEWKVNYEIGDKPLLFIKNNIESIKATIYDVNLNQSNKEFYFELRSRDTKLPVESSQIDRKDFVLHDNATNNLAHWHGNLLVLSPTAGARQLYLSLTTKNHETTENDNTSINVIVKKVTNLHERIFQLAASAIILFMFINLGTVLDLQRLRRIVLFPVGPAVAFTSRYVIMPAIGLGLGFVFFPADKNLQLAVFFSMLSPSGGVANICNFFMRGNIDLSIAATTLNSLMTLAMFPLWIILLGTVVYGRTGLEVPFINLIVSFVGILLALIVGIGIRLCFPKGVVHIIRFLKPLSVMLSLLLVAVTVGVHIVTFQYFTLMMGVAGVVLPLISYFVTYGLAKLTCMESRDAMTIALEIGVMNMTVPTLLLNTSLEPAEADKVLALPITCALTSLLYVTLFYFKRYFYNWQESIDGENPKAKMYVAES